MSNSNNQLLLTGLSLIHDSPFKTSQSPKPSLGFSPTTNQYDDLNFDNLYAYLQNDYHERINNKAVEPSEDDNENDLNYLNDLYKVYLSELSNSLIKEETVDDNYKEVTSNMKNIKISNDIKTLFSVTKSSNTNDLILKILIENSLYNLNQYLESKDDYEFIKASIKPKTLQKDQTILSLDEIKALKNTLYDLYSEKGQCETDIEANQSAMADILNKYNDPMDYKPSSRMSKIELEHINHINFDLEKQLISSSLKKYLASVDNLKRLNQEIAHHKKVLFGHFFTCLILGYINNISVNLKLQRNIQSDSLSPISTPKSVSFDALKSPSDKSFKKIQLEKSVFNKSMDELVGLIASIAAQKDISLPAPVGDISNKTQWIKNCINEILNNNKLKQDKESTLRENVYFRSKQNDSPNSSETSISTDFSPKKNLLNKLSSPTHESRSSSANSPKEVNDLKTRIKDLKFANEYLTKQFKSEWESYNKIITEQNLVKLNLEKKLQNTIQNLEKTNNLVIQNETVNQELEKKLDENFNTITQLQKSLTDLQIESIATESPRRSEVDEPMNDVNPRVSVGMMRKEFKRLIDDINNQHFEELTHEINERKRLENLVKKYKEMA